MKSKLEWMGFTFLVLGSYLSAFAAEFPVILREDAPPSRAVFDPDARPRWPGDHGLFSNAEVRTLIEQGPTPNRINLTIVGDGYTEAEREKFFQDASRTTDELFAANAFQSYLPLFNVYAVFVPSRESGITDTVKKDTALGLYRDPPGSKRAILPGNPQAIDAAVALAPATDFPILLANDDFYGGVGGKYAITTRSAESGILVLRHELGHNFGLVGEEYDAGFVYRGANFSPTKDVPWKSWASGPIQGMEAKFLNGSYVWQKLGDAPVHIEFRYPESSAKGEYTFAGELSGVGWASPEDVYVLLDGTRLSYHGKYTHDRSFFVLDVDRSLAPGPHALDVKEHEPGDHVLAFAEIYALAPGYDTSSGRVDAFATFDDHQNQVGYRPTHASCVMRDLQNPSFCSVDKENMWVRFLTRISLIDDVSVTMASRTRTVSLKAPNLPGLEIAWYEVGFMGFEKELPAFRNLRTWMPEDTAHGNYRVKVHFRTTEVHNYTSSFDAEREFRL